MNELVSRKGEEGKMDEFLRVNGRKSFIGSFSINTFLKQTEGKKNI